MSLTTNLAHYQRPLAGTSAAALQARHDADHRALSMGPALPGSTQTELPAATTVQTSKRVTPPMAYKQWLKMLTGYEDSARPGAGATQDRG